MLSIAVPTNLFEKKWNDSFFESIALKDLGLCLQVGHGGTPCPLALHTPSSLVVIHVNGLHHVRIKYCQCLNAPPVYIQLLRLGWFPASTTRPETCATFQVLRQCHILSLQSKLSTYHFFKSLERLTDNTGLTPLPVMSHCH